MHTDVDMVEPHTLDELGVKQALSRNFFLVCLLTRILLLVFQPLPPVHILEQVLAWIGNERSVVGMRKAAWLLIAGVG
jgi:hypothetical protein